MIQILKIRSAFSLFILILGLISLMACENESGISDREIILKMLTNNGSKGWVVEESNIDGKQINLSSCDSSYILVMKIDFTWEELNLELQCNPSSGGDWSLNEELDVISISYLNPITGSTEEKHFEIEELSDEFFAYQFAENNRLKYVRLKRGE